MSTPKGHLAQLQIRRNEPKTARPVRIAIFVDYWNYLGNMKGLDEHFLTDWRKLRDTVATAAFRKMGGTCFEAQLCCFGSFMPWIPEQCGLAEWARREGEHPDGIVVSLRKWNIEDDKERCVDVDLSVAMTDMAADRMYDVAVLVSKDRDFERAVRSVRSRGIEVILGKVGDGGYRLARHCSGEVDVGQLRERFRGTPRDRFVTREIVERGGGRKVRRVLTKRVCFSDGFGRNHGPVICVETPCGFRRTCNPRQK